jgi:succinate dehydrogenase hydrophobic anchor subunit
MPKRPRRILRRRWATTEGWRGTRAGMWAWLVQRAAAVALLGVIVLHVRTPYWRTVQGVLLALVLVHGLLGARAILLDFGLPVRWHRLLLVIAVALAALIFAAVWGWRWS